MIMPIMTVNDVEASISFYQNMLGFRHDMSMADTDGKPVFAIVGLGAAVFGLGNDPENSSKPPYAPGVQFMVYLPEDQNIDTYYAGVKAKGVTIDEELTDTYWGDRTFSIHDPNGYWLTFAVTVRQVAVEDMEAYLRERDGSA